MTKDVLLTASFTFMFRNYPVRMAVMERRYWLRLEDVARALGLSLAVAEGVLASVPLMHQQAVAHEVLCESGLPVQLVSSACLYRFALCASGERAIAFMEWLNVEALPGFLDGKVPEDMSFYLQNMAETLIQIYGRTGYFLYAGGDGSLFMPMMEVIASDIRRIMRRAVRATWMKLDDSASEQMNPADRAEAWAFNHRHLND